MSQCCMIPDIHDQTPRQTYTPDIHTCTCQKEDLRGSHSSCTKSMCCSRCAQATSYGVGELASIQQNLSKICTQQPCTAITRWGLCFHVCAGENTACCSAQILPWMLTSSCDRVFPKCAHISRRSSIELLALVVL